MELRVSPGNQKMGSIPSISLPAVITCRDCDCKNKCYARKLERIRPSVRNSYQSNLDLLRKHPDVFWREFESVIMASRFFRLHVSGDIPDADYLRNVIKIVANNPHCEVLCFTKRYELVNRFLESGWLIPKNLHIIYSGWPGLEMNNPYSLPEAHVIFKDGTTEANETAVLCNGNCMECAITESGCWNLKYGQQVVFHEH